MKKISLATVALATLITAPAIAADLPARPAPVKAPPPPVIVAYNWTSCYIGGYVGGLRAHKDWIDRDPGSLTFGLSDGTHNPSGFIGGAQAGCDYQFAGGFVIGIAGDYGWTDADGNNLSILYPGFTNYTNVKGLASVTGRIGYAWDRFLGYVKGGGAWEKDEHWYTNGAFTGTASVNRSGWTVGVGGEYAFTNNLSGFVEYDYYDFGTRNVLFNDNIPGGNTPFTFTYGIKETKSVIKAGLNLRWGAGPAPIAARY